ncbi:MAG: pyridoxine 5'-phosphate synthase [Deltaproteobacteria bacterium]|nr:MAG: pyridoxine 5'-phosphate synthase [Deltaproteobacteria bacterium]
MKRLTIALDALATLGMLSRSGEFGITAAATLAQLAGADAIRLGLFEGAGPERERQAVALRRTAHTLELRMPGSPSILKHALELRPDLVVLTGEFRGNGAWSAALDPAAPGLASILRSLAEAGIETAALLYPSVETVKAAHALGFRSIELFTAPALDAPELERAFQPLSDALRLATKLRLEVGIGGGLDYRNLTTALSVAPGVERIVVGRAVIARAALVGLDRAVRDLRSRLA